jgi:DNA-binding transcriptional LysR family regulator
MPPATPSGLSLDLFAIFARLAESGSFSQAARDLAMSKATISKRIAELEAGLGVTLLARTTRRAALTEAGEQVLRRAQKMLEEAESAIEEARETRAVARGRLRIAAPLRFALRYLAPVLPDFFRAYPDIALDLLLDDRVVDLIGGGFDAALRIGDMPDSSFTARKLAPVNIHVVAAPAYWRAHGKPARPEDLLSHACIRYANTASGLVWRFIGPGESVVSVRVDGPLCVNNGDVEMPTICAGIGVARLPDFMVWRDVQEGRLETALEDWGTPPMSLHLLTSASRAQPRRLRAFSDFLAESFGGGRAPWLAMGR